MADRADVSPLPETDAAEDASDRFRVVAEHFVDPLFHAFDGVVTWIGPTIEPTLGWSPDELASTALRDLCHPDDVEDLTRLLDRVSEGRPGRVVVRMRTRDGAYLWALLSLGAGSESDGGAEAVGSIREIDLRIHAEQQLKMIATHAPNVLYTAGPDRRTTWVSPNAERVLGWTAGELLGSVMDDLLHERDRQAVAHRLDLLYRGVPDAEPLDGAIVRVRHKDGHFMWMEATAGVLLSLDGRPGGVIGGFVDVDELVVARNRIRDDAARLRTILDSLLDAHVVLKPIRDRAQQIADFRCDDVNDAALRFLGRSRDEVIGIAVTELLPEMETQRLLAMLASAVDTGEPLVVEDFPFPDVDRPGSERHFEIRAVRFDDALSLIWRDVTEHRETVAALAASEEAYRLMAENSSDVVVRGRGGVVLWVSPSLVSMLGWQPEQWVGRRFADFVHASDLVTWERESAVVEAGGSMVQRYRVRDREGSYHWVEAHPTPYRDARGDRDGLVFSFRTIDSEVAAHRELDRRARHDELTGLLNRKEVLERISTLGGPLRRTGSRSAVLFCDVDRFKAVNDTHGHAVGDVVLREIALRMSGCVRSRDLVARVGGDEMLVVLDGVHGLDDAVLIAEKIRHAVEQPIVVGDVEVSTSLSVGVALARPGEPIDALVARADDAMFRAKAAGRNQVIPISDADGHEDA